MNRAPAPHLHSDNHWPSRGDVLLQLVQRQVDVPRGLEAERFGERNHILVRRPDLRRGFDERRKLVLAILDAEMKQHRLLEKYGTVTNES